MRITGTDSLYGLVPMCAVAGAMYGALAAAAAFPPNAGSGLLSRLWVLPVHRASALTGRLLAEAVRTLGGAALITAVGVGLGLRFKGGWLAVIPFLLVPVMVVVVFSMASNSDRGAFKGRAVLVWLGVPAIGLVFSSSGVLVTGALRVRPEIHLQPMAPTIESMRALAQGVPALWPLLLSLMWVVGLAAMLGPLAVHDYRAAAESGP